MKKQFLVALHVQSYAQVLAQVELILKGGADGVLLVNNGGYILSGKMDTPNLFKLTQKVKEKYSNFIVGINPLDLKPFEALELATEFEIDILWVDNGGIEEQERNVYIPVNLKTLIKDYPGKYFGGTAFKYQPTPLSLESVTALAAEHFDVVVTSGPGTGQPAKISQIKTMRQYAKDTPLAIASGMSSENVSLFYEYCDIFIVGTSLQTSPSDPFHYDVGKVRDFKNAMNDCEKAVQVVS